GAETATWGGMLADGRNYVASAWWLAVFPGVAIFSVVMAVNLVGDWLRDRYDPRSPFRNLSSTEGQNVPDRGAAQSMTWQGTASVMKPQLRGNTLEGGPAERAQQMLSLFPNEADRLARSVSAARVLVESQRAREWL